MAAAVANLYVAQREKLGFPLCKYCFVPLKGRLFLKNKAKGFGNI